MENTVAASHQQIMGVLATELHEDIAAIVELGYILKQMSIEGTDLGKDEKAFPCAASFGKGEYTRIMGRAIEALALDAEERILDMQYRMKEMEETACTTTN